MAKLNWRDASKELPDPFVKCIVFIKAYDGVNIDIDFTESMGEFSKYGALVTHWIYIYNLPFPEGKL